MPYTAISKTGICNNCNELINRENPPAKVIRMLLDENEYFYHGCLCRTCYYDKNVTTILPPMGWTVII